MQTEHQQNSNMREQAKYFEVPGAHLYTVLHSVADPVARVLFVGPFASERQNTYMPWVRWARYLAERKIEVLRYDYRGIGESTGVFEEMTFGDWEEDVRLLAEWLNYQSPNVPLILHGLEMGALLAGRAFHAGAGDGLLLWAPPTTANQALRSTLKRRIGIEQLFKRGSHQKSVSDYIRELEGGSFLEIDGYLWSTRLWRESFDVELPTALATGPSFASFSGKPVRIVRLDKEIEPLTNRESSAPNGDDSFTLIRSELVSMCGENFKWHHSFKFWSEFRPYFRWLFTDNYTWIAEFAGLVEEEQ